MPVTQAHRRLLRDYKKLTAQSPDGIAAAPVGDDLFKWVGIIIGPQGTAWEGGVWKLDMAFPQEYPAKPPTVRFQSEVFHPNVYPQGTICLDILRTAGWSPSYDVSAILVAIQALLTDPDAPVGMDEANAEASALYANNRPAYFARVKALIDKQIAEDDRNMGCLSAVP